MYPFAGDRYIESRILELKEQYGITSAVETGTYLGATFAWLYNNFDKVYSCEINALYYQAACNLIFNKTRESIKYPGLIENPPEMGEMIIANEDSSSFIKSIASKLDDECMFFLDAHWYEHCPLLDELEMIAQQELRPALIAIHDFKTNHPTQLGYDSYNAQDFTLEWILPFVEKIYKNDWTYEYNEPDMASGALRGIIYIKKHEAYKV